MRSGQMGCGGSLSALECTPQKTQMTGLGFVYRRHMELLPSSLLAVPFPPTRQEGHTLIGLGSYSVLAIRRSKGLELST